MDELLQRMIDALIELIEGGEQVPDEVLETVTQILLERVQQGIEPSPVATSETPPIEVSGEEINHGETPYPSSNINAFRYDPKSGQLFVKFMGKDVANAGPTYSYEGVPPFLFDILRRGAVGPKTSGSNKWHTWKKGVTPSHGAAMSALIKAGGFPYKRIS